MLHPEILQIEKLRLLGTQSNAIKKVSWICTVRHQDIWDSRFGGFRECRIFSGTYHIHPPARQSYIVMRAREAHSAMHSQISFKRLFSTSLFLCVISCKGAVWYVFCMRLFCEIYRSLWYVFCDEYIIPKRCNETIPSDVSKYMYTHIHKITRVYTGTSLLFRAVLKCLKHPKVP